MNPIAVCLQTCERYDLTARTLETFARHNDLAKFTLLHGDDASVDDRILPLVQSYGFETVVHTATRSGVLAVRAKLIARAKSRAAWLLLLENDIETLRTFPWALFEHIRKDRRVYCLRLYGRYKDRARTDKCLETHKWHDHAPAGWKALKGAPEKAQIGLIHWSPQPCVTRSKALLAIHRAGPEPTGLTVRVKNNVTSHIGAERTPGRIV